MEDFRELKRQALSKGEEKGHKFDDCWEKMLGRHAVISCRCASCERTVFLYRDENSTLIGGPALEEACFDGSCPATS